MYNGPYDLCSGQCQQSQSLELSKEYDAWKGSTKKFDPHTRVVNVIMGIHNFQNN